jgi:hypothetical protein
LLAKNRLLSGVPPHCFGPNLLFRVLRCSIPGLFHGFPIVMTGLRAIGKYYKNDMPDWTLDSPAFRCSPTLLSRLVQQDTRKVVHRVSARSEYAYSIHMCVGIETNSCLCFFTATHQSIPVRTKLSRWRRWTALIMCTGSGGVALLLFHEFVLSSDAKHLHAASQYIHELAQCPPIRERCVCYSFHVTSCRLIRGDEISDGSISPTFHTGQAGIWALAAVMAHLSQDAVNAYASPFPQFVRCRFDPRFCSHAWTELICSLESVCSRPTFASHEILYGRAGTIALSDRIGSDLLLPT